MEKIIVGILAYVYVRIVSAFKSVDYTSVTQCDQTVIVMDNVSTKKFQQQKSKKEKYYSNKCD